MNIQIFIPAVILFLSILNFAGYTHQSNKDQIRENIHSTSSDLVLRASPMDYQRVNFITGDKLNERLAKGRDTTFVVNFWATWCAPCIKELPHFEKLQQEKRKEKLKVLLVSVDFRSRLENSVIPFVEKRGLKNEVFLLDETDQQKYIDKIDNTWSGAIPATLFVKGKNRKFVEKEFTYSSLLTEYQHFK